MLKRFTPILTLTAICWLVFGVNSLLFNGGLTRYGITPRELGGLAGIIWAPVLHGSFTHLAANTLPLLVLGAILCARHRGEFTLVTAAGVVGGGGLTWLLARNASHIGASGLIFCYFGYLVSLAYFNRTLGTLLLSVVCLLGYGGMLRGILPTAGMVSWEGHLAGLAAGVGVGWFIAKVRKTPLEPGAPASPSLPP